MRKKEAQKHCNSQPSPSPSPARSISPLRLHRSPSRVFPISKPLLRSLQGELRSQVGCTLSPGSLPFLGHYLQSHRMLRSILSTPEHPSPNGFLREYSRLHSEQRVGKLYTLVMDHEHQMRRNNKLYSRECLADYFQLAAFSEERVVTTLVRIVVQGRAKGLIGAQERRKKKKTHFPPEEKENRQGETRTIGNFQETKVYFAILALKMLLKEPELNSERINHSCQQIKAGMEECLGSMKLRQEGTIKSTRSSIFRRL